MKMKGINSRFRIILSIAIMLIGMAFLCINVKGEEVSAQVGYTVTFDYNTSALSSNMPMTDVMSASVENYSISNFDNGYLTSNDVRMPNQAFNPYYSYVWTWNNQVVEDITEFQIIKNTVFVMKWTPKTYYVNFYFTSDEIKSQVTNLVERIEFTVESPRIELYEPEIPNYHFDGWYNGAAHYDLLYLPAGSTGSKNFTARLTPTEYYINYHTNAKNSDNPKYYNVTDGIITLAEPSQEGHIFKGWYLDTNYNDKVTTIDASLGGNINLYPLWELEVYTVTYILPNGYSRQVKVEYGKKADLPNIEKSIFEIIVTDASRKNITEDTTIRIKVVNIWYVYVIALVLIAGTITTVILVKKKRENVHDNLRERYQLAGTRTRATVSIIEKRPVSTKTNKTTTRTQTKPTTKTSTTKKIDAKNPATNISNKIKAVPKPNLKDRTKK